LLSESSKKILIQINECPGIRYRELLRSTGLSNGVLSFHLKKLQKSKLLRAKRIGYKVKRYYPIAVKANESDILDHIMHPTRRKIIFFLLTNSKCKLKEIAYCIDRAKSTTSFQLKSLKHAGIISVLGEGYKNKQFYRLKNKSRIIRTVKKYKIMA
jgi:predicted transcriptional regulator